MSAISNLPEVHNYLGHAKALTRDVLDPEPRFSKASNYSPYYNTPGYYYHHDTGSGFWNMIFPQRHRVDHYHHTVDSSKKDKKSNTDALVAAAALAVVGGMLLYNIGGEVGKRSNAVEDLNKLAREKNIVLMDLKYNNASEMSIYKVNDIMSQHQDILNTYKDDAESRLLIKGTVTTGIALGFATCLKAWMTSSAVYEASPYMVLAGLALTTGGGLAWALKAGFDSTSETVKRKAQDLMSSIKIFEQSHTQGA